MTWNRLSHSLMVAIVLAVICAQPGWAAPLPSPSQPILVVQNSISSDPYQNFVPELLTTEGFNGFQTAQLGDLTSAFLANYDVVILPHLTLTAAQATLFQNYINAGGTLVGFRPDVQLAAAFGVASLGATLPEAWLKIDTTTPYGSALVSDALRFHGTADLYSLTTAKALATLYSSSTLSTTSPAVTINRYGLGTAILFSFDLTQSVVLMRQGNPAWAGYPNNHDGFNTMRASGMFMDKTSGQFWNDLGDGTLNDIPQADIQMRLFSNVVTLTNAAKRPLPRFWYFPNQNRAMLLMTGDDHSFPVANALGEVSDIASHGGLFSYNLWYPFDPLNKVSTSQLNSWLGAGNSIGVHFDDTAEVDASGIGGSAASWKGMQSVMSTALTSFAATYPGAPFPITTRNHFLIWVSNDANGGVDQVAQAKLFQNNRIQLDTSYTAFPNRWGYMTGSGLPMKFLDTVSGALIPVYEQATQYEDDIQLLSAGYSTEWDQLAAQGHYLQSLSDSLNKYNTVVTMLFHPENWSSTQASIDPALQYAQTHSISMSSAGNWLTFWKARAATALSMPTFSARTLTFTASGSPAGLTLLVPEASGNNEVVSVFKVDGVSHAFTVAQYQGVMYASVVLTAGSHDISVSYNAGGRVHGRISPSAAVPGTRLRVQGGSITETVSPASDGSYVVGPLPAGIYKVTPLSSNYTFLPASKNVGLGRFDVTNVDFTGTLTGETLFTTQVPNLTNRTDGPEVQYELGTAFTSDVPGQITGVRFWKAPGESGTHSGKIWSSTGTLLASATFANETASGWQQQNLAVPLSISANAMYVVSVNTSNTYYAATQNGLATQVRNMDLSTVVGNNGLYGSPGAFPTNSNLASNYFRDVVFVPIPLDDLAPVTSATPIPAPNQNGWNRTDVLISIAAQDGSGGSGVKQIQFSLSGAQNQAAHVVLGNSASTFVHAEGTTVVTYFAVDSAGNQEKPKTITVRIDKTNPMISGMPPRECVLTARDGQSIPVATVKAADTISAISPGSFKLTAKSNQPGRADSDILISPLSENTFQVFLRANRTHGEERVTISVMASDLAGNSTRATATCIVDSGHHDHWKSRDDERVDFYDHHTN